MKTRFLLWVFALAAAGCGARRADRPTLPVGASAADRAAFEAAADAFEAGHHDVAAEAFTNLIEADPKGPLAPHARDYLARIAERRELEGAAARAGTHPAPPDTDEDGDRPVARPDEDAPALAPGSADRASTAIGLLLPLSGRSQPLGRALAETAHALDDDAGQADGGPMLYMEDAGEPAKVEAAVARLVDEHAVFGLVGLFDQQTAPVAAEAAAARNVPLLMLTLSDAATQVEGPVWRVLHTPLLVARTAAGAALARGGQRAAVLRPEGAYGETLAGWFVRVWQAGGGEVVGEVTWDATTVDWARVAKRAAALDADTIFVPSDPLSAAQLMSHLAAQGVFARGQQPRYQKEKGVREVVVVGSPEWYTPSLLRQAGRYLEGALIPVPFAVETARGARFAAQVERATRSPNAYDALLADSIRALGDAHRRHRDGGGDPVAAMGQVEVTEGATAGLRFDKRDAVPALFVLEVRNGAFVPLE